MSIKTDSSGFEAEWGWVSHWGQSAKQIMMEGERHQEILAVEDDGWSTISQGIISNFRQPLVSARNKWIIVKIFSQSLTGKYISTQIFSLISLFTQRNGTGNITAGDIGQVQGIFVASAVILTVDEVSLTDDQFSKSWESSCLTLNPRILLEAS